MKWIYVLLTCAAVLLLSSCGGDSSLPEATGKGNIRAVNAILTSEEINFLIEERSIGTATYQNTTSSARYDDLNYTFHVEALFAGEATARRVASQNVDIVADRDYTFLVSGALANPTISVWEDDERVFDDAETVFEARFANASVSPGSFDYYFADPSAAPAPENLVATLAFGEISPAADFPEGDYVLTVTTAGDPGAIAYVSDTTSLTARNELIVIGFDGDDIQTAPKIVRAFNSFGSGVTMPDARFLPTVEFINASMELGTSDIYDDEMLTSLSVADHAYLDVSAELDLATDTTTFYYTPAGGTTGVTLETTLAGFGGTRYRIVATGVAEAFAGRVIIPDRRPIESHAKFVIYQTSNNFSAVDVYVVATGETIDDVFPVRGDLTPGLQVPSAGFATGSYDIYVTENRTKNILAGPYGVDVALGDIVDLIIVDTVDPAVVDILFLSGGPTP